MKLPLILTLLICAAGALWGWHEHQKQSGLRARQQQLLVRLRAIGVEWDPLLPYQPAKLSDRSSMNDAATSKAYADRMVIYSRKLLAARENDVFPVDLQNESMEMMSGLLKLNAEQVKLLVQDLKSRSDLTDEVKKNAMGLSIMMLAEQYPQRALALFGESSALLKGDYTARTIVSRSIARWAEDDPDAALRWIESNKQKYPNLVNDASKESILQGAARKDIGLAIQLMGELKMPANLDEISDAVNSPEQQESLLAALRKSPEHSEIRKHGMVLLARKLAESGFDEATAFLKTNALSKEEMAVVVSQMDYSRIKGNSGKWLDWYDSQSLDTSEVKDSAESIISSWTQKDYKAAGEWLNQAKSGPIKDAATRSYIETVALYDSEVAVQWAETLSAPQKDDAMKRILDKLKGSDEVAARAFAQKHQMEFSTEDNE